MATCNLKDKPNVIVVTSQKVIGDDKILITGNCFVKTRKNLLQNKKIALAVCNKGESEAYQFKGIAQYLTKGKWEKIVDVDPENKLLNLLLTTNTIIRIIVVYGAGISISTN